MNILQIIPQLGSGGAEKFCVELSNALVKKNRLTLIVLHDLKIRENQFFLDNVSNNISVINLNKKMGFDLFIIFKLFRYIYLLKPDVINTHLNCLAYTFFPALFFRKKIYHTVHNIAHKEQDNTFLRKIYYFIFKSKLATPVAISEEVKKSIFEEYNLSYVPIIENGVLPLNNTPEFKTVQKKVRSLKFNKNTKVFLTIARFTEQKNLSLLISVINKKVSQKKNIIYFLIGDGDQYEKIKLKKLAGPNIFFLGKVKNVSDYMECCDLFCLSSKWEGLPITILEAFSLNKVVCSTSVGGVVDIIESGINGFLAKEVSFASYEDAVDEYLKLSSHEIQVMSDSIRNSFEKRFNIQISAENYLSLFKDNC